MALKIIFLILAPVPAKIKTIISANIQGKINLS